MVHVAGYQFFLAWLVIAFTRGHRGVTFVGDHLLDNWQIFCDDFHSYVGKLVKAAKDHCDVHGPSSLSHIESYHTSLSGLRFLLTLKKKINRDRLIKIAAWSSTIIGRLLDGKGHSCLRVSEFIKISIKIKTVVLAVRTTKEGDKKNAHVGAYNQQQAMRCLEHTIEHVLGCQEMTYTNEIHEWYAKRQSKKSTAESKALVEEFKLNTTKTMQKYIKDLQKCFPGETVNKGTANVNTCELRQSINMIGISRMMFIAEMVCKSTAKATELRLAIQEKTKELAMNPYANCKAGCHSVQVCTVAHEMLEDGLSNSEISYPACLVFFAKAGLSPKCKMEGIPEWLTLLQIMKVIRANSVMQCDSSLSYHELIHQLRVRKLTARTRKGGRKLSKTEMRNKLQRHKNLIPTVGRSRSRKRKALNSMDLEKMMTEAGGNPRPYVQGKQRRLTVPQLKRWLKRNGVEVVEV